MKIIVSIAIMILSFCSIGVAADYEITNIAPIFNKATPEFGEFKIQVGIKSKLSNKSDIKVACLYVGLTGPGRLLQKRGFYLEVQRLEAATSNGVL